MALSGIYLIAGFIFGFLFSKYGEKIRLKLVNKKKVKAAYMLINIEVLDEPKLKKYQDEAVPLAEAAGCQLLASASPELLSGNWPYRGELVLEKFESMDALKTYWDSEEYQSARKLLQGADIRDFTVIFESWD